MSALSVTPCRYRFGRTKDPRHVRCFGQVFAHVLLLGSVWCTVICKVRSSRDVTPSPRRASPVIETSPCITLSPYQTRHLCLVRLVLEVEVVALLHCGDHQQRRREPAGRRPRTALFAKGQTTYSTGGERCTWRAGQRRQSSAQSKQVLALTRRGIRQRNPDRVCIGVNYQARHTRGMTEGAIPDRQVSDEPLAKLKAVSELAIRNAYERLTLPTMGATGILTGGKKACLWVKGARG